MKTFEEAIRDAFASAKEEMKDPAVVERIGDLSKKVNELLVAQEDPRQAAHNIMGLLTRFLISIDGYEAVARRYDLFAATLRTVLASKADSPAQESETN